MGKSIEEINYKPSLDLLLTQQAIKAIKDSFERKLAKKLNLTRVSAPLFVTRSSGLNDNLSGVEEPVHFSLPWMDSEVEIVQSLAKWKRFALGAYSIPINQGIYTDMNAIRKDENPDYLHSIYVDQWDWEKTIGEKQRTLAYLRKTVKAIYSCIYATGLEIEKKYPSIKAYLPKDIVFVSSKELEEKYPNLTRKEREEAVCREHKAVFLYRIGGKLKDGKPHDQRAADYDDWSLNGDILVYYPLYDTALELSSMGIRVNAKSLEKQLKAKGELAKLGNPYCQAILHDELPLSIGGGIGQSRLCLAILQKAHIGEVQSSLWSQQTRNELKEKGIFLL